MKKTILLILFTILFQNIFSQRWEHIYGNPGTTEAPGDVIESYDLGYIVSNSYESSQGNWLFKTDINGNILWEKLLTWESTVVYTGYIKQDNNGNTIIATSISNEENGNWPMMIKIDSCGEKVWCRVFPKEGYEFGYYTDVLILNNGDYLGLGVFFKDTLDRVHLDYVDKDGNLLWRKAYAKKLDYPLIDSPYGRGLFQYEDNYYIYGYCYWAYPSNPNHYFLKPMFIGIDSMFNEKWILPFGVSDTLFGDAYDIINVNDSVFMGVGFAYKGAEIVSLISCFDKDGNELNFAKIPNESFGTEVKQCNSKKIHKINDSLFIVLASWGNENIWAGGEYITDTSGNVYNFQYRPNTGGGREIIKTVDSNFVIGIGLIEGKTDWNTLLYKIDENLESVPFDTNQYTYDSLCFHQIQSGTIDLSGCLIVIDIGETPTPEEYYAKLKTIPIKAFPNPAKENITLAFENTKYHKNMQLECFDVFGHKVHKEKIYTAQLEAEINISQWNEGLYVAVVMSNGKVLGKVKFVVLR